jgi:hypothetical protein
VAGWAKDGDEMRRAKRKNETWFRGMRGYVEVRDVRWRRDTAAAGVGRGE